MATLPTKLLIDAARTQAQSKGQIMTFLQKGDPDSGQILLVFFDALSRKCRIARRERDWDTGDYVWMPVKENALLSGDEVQQYVDRATKIDPDLWVIEIEASPAENPFL